MARLPRLGPIIRDSPEIEAKFGPRNPGDLSSYESREGGALNTLDYYGGTGWDPDKSLELASLRKEYGPAVENVIARKWQRAVVEKFGFNRMPVPQGSYMALAQDEFLKEMKQRRGLRNAYQKAKNPMLY